MTYMTVDELEALLNSPALKGLYMVRKSDKEFTRTLAEIIHEKYQEEKS